MKKRTGSRQLVMEERALANALESHLPRYEPRESYIDQLRTRLVAQQNTVMESQSIPRAFLLAMIALFGSVILLIWLIFYLISFFNDND